MQRIERYGVLALVFLLVTLVTFALWDDETGPGADKLSTAAAAKEAPARQLTAAERQHREAQRRREEAARDLEAARAKDLAKRNSLSEQYQSGKNAADLQAKAKHNAATGGIVKSDKPVIDGAPAKHSALVIRQEPTHEVAANHPGAVGNLVAPVTPSHTAETQADRNRQMIDQMDKQRRQRDHFVAKGETLSKIAQEQLGSSRRVNEIVAMNPGLDPDRVYVGQKIKLPAAGASVSVDTSSRPATVAPPSNVASVKGPGGSYTIQSGDVLSRIAQDHLGSVKAVASIMALNPGLDPNHLKVGQVIALPEGAVATSTTPVASSTRNVPTNRPATDSRPRVR